MDAKLTLKLNKDVIKKAKAYAASHHGSLSRLIESYLKSLVLSDEQSLKNEEDITPFIKSMSTGVHISADLDTSDEYLRYIEDKHK